MTTTNTFVIGADPAYTDLFVNGAWFWHLGGIMGRLSPESQRQSKAELAFTVANLAARTGAANTYGAGAASVTFRKNSAAGNGSVPVGGAGANILIVDSTHSDSLAVGDVNGLAWTSNSSSPDCNLGLTSASFSAASPAIQYAMTCPTQWNVSATLFWQIIGSATFGDTSEGSSSQTSIRARGVLSGLAATLTSSAFVATITSRKNSGAGNQSLSISNSNGIVVDTTHSDALSAGDTADTNSVTSSGSGAVYGYSYAFAGGTSKHDIGCTADTAFAAAASITAYHPFGASISQALTAEAKAEAKMPYATTASNLRIQVTANSAQTVTLGSRKNAGAGNQSASVGSSATGTIEDVTHTDSYASGDLINAQTVTGGSGTVSWSGILVSLNDGSNAGSSSTARHRLISE